MDPPVITPACEDLIGTAPPDARFELTASSTGTVLEVDESLVEQTAMEHFELTRPVGVELEPDSVAATRAGEPIVRADSVTFPVDVRAMATRPCDAGVVERDIAGKSVAEARRLVARCGDATLTIWPDFVPTVPDDLGRITVTIE
jgi:hypothetical protein